jgi:hypothetical protein
MKNFGLRAFLVASAALLANHASAGIFTTYTDAGGMSMWKDPFCQETPDGYAIELDETWRHFTPSFFLVGENSFSELDGGTSGGGASLDIDKNALNLTGFNVTGWIINITPNPGASIKLIEASSDRFDDVDLIEFDDGSAQIVYSMDGIDDTAVLTGESLNMYFKFHVNGGFGFTIKQTPVPTPGVLALLAAAGFVGAPRRRRNA